MGEKRMIPCLYLYQGQAAAGREDRQLLHSGSVEEIGRFYSDNGADELLVFDLSDTDVEHEKAIGKIKELCEISQAPVTAAGNIRRMEDVKKFLYAGCHRVFLDFSDDSQAELLKEASDRFGKEKIAAGISNVAEFLSHKEMIEQYAGAVFGTVDMLKECILPSDISLFVFASEGASEKDVLEYLRDVRVHGICGDWIGRMDRPIMEFKRVCAQHQIPVNLFESKIAWKDFKLNSEGLIPVIVQDYQTDEVLMLAYMNEEAFTATLRTGKMTYWSRSRKELWVKGMTSGHFQYVKSLTLDCDNDTILAKAEQVGAACHTGNHTCFFKELASREYDDTNPLKVFQQVYDVILDRQKNPKEGSYTNYLFEKGIDKILKKLGEECTEIVIAAKNPDKEEIKYEISDFLYHMMVLMAEKGVSWEDITRELARR